MSRWSPANRCTVRPRLTPWWQSLPPVRERPSDISDRELAAVLLAKWELAVAGLRYLPVGFGGYHWLATDAAASRWFVTVTDLAGPYGADLHAAMETAADLAARGLDFAVVPVRTAQGQVVARLGARYAVTVFPYVRGEAGRWGDPLSAADRLAITAMLAALHAVAPPGQAPVRALGLAGRGELSLALRERHVRWTTGPYAEPARGLLAEHADGLVSALDRFDALVRQVGSDGRPLVITHGEPHPGNLLRDGPGFLLVDWDSVGIAPPERDLHWVLTDYGHEAAAYTAMTGHTVSQDAVALYRLRWPLDDIRLFLAELRGPHRADADTGTSLAGLATSLEALAML
jgi:spectinomycin phosphotransferase